MMHKSKIFSDDRVELIEQIKFYSQQCIDAKQVAQRLKKLAPESLEHVDIERDALYHRIQYETHLMMYQARVSLDSFRRAKKGSK